MQRFHKALACSYLHDLREQHTLKQILHQFLHETWTISHQRNPKKLETLAKRKIVEIFMNSSNEKCISDKVEKLPLPRQIIEQIKQQTQFFDQCIQRKWGIKNTYNETESHYISKLLVG